MPNNPYIVRHVQATSLSPSIAACINPFRPIGAHVSNGSIASAVTISIGSLNNDELEDQVNCIFMTATGQPVRFTLDGTTPTSSVGFLINTNENKLIYLTSGMTIRVIQGAATGQVDYQFGRLL